MRKYFLLTILFVTIIFGCEKNDEPRTVFISNGHDGVELIISDYLSKKTLNYIQIIYLERIQIFMLMDLKTINYISKNLKYKLNKISGLL
jgi:hypothetical protein